MSTQIGEAEIVIKGDSSQFEGAMGKMGGIATKAGLGIAAGLGGGAIAAATSFAGFDQSMREVFTLLPDASGDSLSAMSDDVLDFSNKFGKLPDEVIPSLYNAISAGQGDDPFGFLDTSAKLATAGVADLDVATSALSGAVNAFEADGLTAEQAADIMFTTVAQGVTTIDELASNMSTVTPTAGALGVSFEEIGASVATFTAATGAGTAETMTKFNSVMNEALVPSSKLSASFMEMSGQSIPDFIAGGGTLNGALNELRDSTNGNDAAFASMFGSSEALSFAMKTTGEGADLFTEKMDAMGESTGAVDKAFETMDQGMIPAFNRMKSVAVTSLIKIGDAIAPVIEGMFNKIVEYLPIVSAFVSDNIIPALQTFADFVMVDVVPVIKDLARIFVEDVVPAIIEFGAIVVDIVLGIVDFVAAVVDITTEVVAWLDKADMLEPVLIGIGTAVVVAGIGIIATMVPAMITWATTTWAAVAAQIALYAPIVAIGVAIGALVAGVIYAYQNFDWFRNSVDAVASFMRDTLWPVLKAIATFIATVFVGAFNLIITVASAVIGAVKALVSFLTDSLFPSVSSLPELFSAVWNGIKATVTTVMEAIKAFLSAIWEGIKDTALAVWEGIKTGITAVMDAIKAVITTVWDAIKAASLVVWEGIKTGITAVMDAIKLVITTVWEIIKTGITAYMDAIKLVIATVWDAIKLIVTTVMDAIKLVITTVWDAIKATFDTVLGFISTAVSTYFEIYRAAVSLAMDAIKLIITTVWDAIKLVITTVLDGIKLVITTVWDAIKLGITTVMDAIKLIITTVWDAVKAAIDTVLGLIGTAMTTAWDGFKTTVTTVMDAIKLVIDTVWGLIKGIFTTQLDLIKGVVTGDFGSMQGTIDSIMNAIKGVISSIWESIKSTISTVLSSIKSKVSEEWNNIKTRVGNLVQDIVDSIKTKFDKIKSNITDAINGAKDNFTAAFDKMTSPIQKVIDKVQGLIDKIKNIKMPSFGGIGGALFGADGGLFTSATNMIIGEAGPEVLLPLTRPQRMADLLSNPNVSAAVSAAMSTTPVEAANSGGAQAPSTGGSGATYNFHGVDLAVALEMSERSERRQMSLRV